MFLCVYGCAYSHVCMAMHTYSLYGCAFYVAVVSVDFCFSSQQSLTIAKTEWELSMQLFRCSAQSNSKLFHPMLWHILLKFKAQWKSGGCIKLCGRRVNPPHLLFYPWCFGFSLHFPFSSAFVPLGKKQRRSVQESTIVISHLAFS